MKGLAWRSIGRDELAELLKNAEQLSSAALGEATIYRLAGDERDMIAIALADGHALVVEAATAPPAKRRRRVDTGRITPATR